LIEDDPKASGFLKRGLEENGFVVEAAFDGSTGLTLAKSGGFDLVILDIMLPQMTGWNILAELRSKGVTTPVLYLTARDNLEDRVRGLDLGADAYLIKPFAFSEVLATIRAILRRGGSGTKKPASRYSVADLELDEAGHRVSRAGKQIQLTAKEFALLTTLMKRTGDLLSRAVIAEEVWGIKFDTDTNLVDVHIRRLRAKVDDPFENKLIHTVRGVGYTLQDRAGHPPPRGGAA
jgi:two-component system copper resistance phosphate regulon response regulator CusR